MKKNKLFLLIFIVVAIAGPNHCCGFSVHVTGPDAEQDITLNNLKVSAFLKLSASQFNQVTGKKMNALDKLLFTVVKMQMKHDLKKNPDLQMNDFIYRHNSKFQRILFWILIGMFAMLGLFFLMFGFAPR